MDNKEYTTKQEQLARFAKAMGHPARIAILEFLIKQNSLFFRRYSRGSAHCQGDCFTTLERVERCGTDTRRDRNTESEILYQPGELENRI